MTYKECAQCGNKNPLVTTFTSLEGRRPDQRPARETVTVDCNKCGHIEVYRYEYGKLIEVKDD